MLAVVLSNGAVQVFQPPVQALEFEWVSVASPSNVLLQHLQRVDFDISRPAVRHIPWTHQEIEGLASFSSCSATRTALTPLHPSAAGF